MKPARTRSNSDNLFGINTHLLFDGAANNNMTCMINDGPDDMMMTHVNIIPYRLNIDVSVNLSSRDFQMEQQITLQSEADLQHVGQDLCRERERIVAEHEPDSILHY